MNFILHGEEIVPSLTAFSLKFFIIKLNFSGDVFSHFFVVGNFGRYKTAYVHTFSGDVFSRFFDGTVLLLCPRRNKPTARGLNTGVSALSFDKPVLNVVKDFWRYEVTYVPAEVSYLLDNAGA